MIKRWSVVLLLILTLVQGAHAADNIGGSAQVSWRSTSTTTDGKEDKSWSLNQIYNLGLSKNFTPQISFTADTGINISETNNTKTTHLSPKFRLNLTNVYFNANGGYQLSEQGLEIFGMPSDDARLTTETWTANLSTKSENYPKIRFRYEEDKTYDYLSVHETDTLSRFYDVSADYAYKILNFKVKHSNDINDNFVNNSTQTTTTDEGRVEFRKSFWDNRIDSSGSYRWTEQETERVARGEEVRFRTERDRETGLYILDTTPDITDLLTDTPSLIDGNIGASAAINIGTDGSVDQNIGAELVSSEEVEEIWIYTAATYTDNTNNPVEWEVYSSDNGTNWVGPIAGATSEYIQTERRFKISFTAKTAKFFKVVNTNTASISSPNLFVTEIKLFGYTTQAPHTTDSTTRTTENIIFNAGIRPTDWMRVTYNFTQDENKTDLNSRATKQSAHNISARANANLHKNLKAWAQYQTRLEYRSEGDRTSSDTYSLHFDSSPLETLKASLSLNHSIYKTASVTQSKTSSSLLHIAAALREGVDLSVDGNLNYTEDPINDTETFARSVYSDLRLKLTKRLTTEIKYTTDWTTTQNSDGTETSGRNSTTATDIYYRPTRSFYFRYSYQLQRDNEGEESTVNQYNINWVMTEKLRLNMGYAVNRNSNVSSAYTSDLAWNLSKVFVLRFGYNWSRQKADTVTTTQTFTSILSARF